MKKSKEIYVKGFEDCIKCFEDTIQIEINNIEEDPSRVTFLKSFDSIIATLYLAKLHVCDLTRMDDELGQLFQVITNPSDKDFEDVQKLFDFLKEEDDE